MIPTRIHQIWLGDAMPAAIERMVATVKGKNPEFLHTLWTDDMLPTLGIKADRLKDEFGTWAAVSNFVRLLVLQRFGGIYLDTDFECLKSIIPLLGHEAVAAEQDGGRICNAFMGAPPNHPWINWQLANIGKYDRRDAASGVYLATDAPRDGLTLIPRHRVFPWLYDDPPENRMPHADSILAHYWEGSWVTK